MRSAQGLVCAVLLMAAPFALADDGPPRVETPAQIGGAAGRGVDANPSWPAARTPVGPIPERGVPNFGRLNADIWRSGQPTGEGYRRLAAEGLKTVVNLRVEFPQDRALVPQGVRYIYIPIRDQHEPTESQAKAFLDVVSDPENWPVLVHCQAGQGRTGTLCAVVRHSLDGWDHDRVMREVGKFEIRILGLIKAPMASCQVRFIRHWEQTAPGPQDRRAPETERFPHK